VLFGARPDEYHRVMGEGHVCTRRNCAKRGA
jgi:hypothetical protein